MVKKRRPLYFSEVKDQDLIEYIRHLESHYNFGHVVKELMRDGMKYRRLIETGQIFENGEQPRYYKVSQSNTPKINKPKPVKKQSLSNVKLTRKEVDEDDISDKLLEL